MLDLFQKGGPIMWPLTVTSIVALTLIIERALFVWRQEEKARPEEAAEIISYVRRGLIPQAVAAGLESEDIVAQVLAEGIKRRNKSLSNALLQAALQRLVPYGQGIAALETIVTLAPLLGLLGTVTGMIRAFGLMGAKELEAPVAITGGISEALIATAFGLVIAIVALVPLNFLISYQERVKRRIEQAATDLEIEMAPVASKSPYEVTV
ncbi:MAG: MotA/TolQ/ExbB proton channel family protein [Candidatus Omnitrophica bacterium]|nr:MotA/TolQ/ExbB proton channel family protein [Candidatus Omnitrophota bacterium]